MNKDSRWSAGSSPYGIGLISGAFGATGCWWRQGLEDLVFKTSVFGIFECRSVSREAFRLPCTLLCTKASLLYKERPNLVFWPLIVQFVQNLYKTVQVRLSSIGKVIDLSLYDFVQKFVQNCTREANFSEFLRVRLARRLASLTLRNSESKPSSRLRRRFCRFLSAWRSVFSLSSFDFDGERGLWLSARLLATKCRRFLRQMGSKSILIILEGQNGQIGLLWAF